MRSDEMRLVALTDVSELLSCSVSHVRALQDRGELPAARDTRGRRLFFLPDVLRLKAARERAKATQPVKGKPRLAKAAITKLNLQTR